MVGEEDMSQEGETELWKELEGLPPDLKSELEPWLRLGTKEPSWRRSLFVMDSIDLWIWRQLKELPFFVATAFGSNEKLRVSDDGIDTWRLIGEVLMERLEKVFPVLELHQSLSEKLAKEIREALQVHRSGVDE